VDRRAVQRTNTFFKPACIISEDTVAMGRLLNFSIGGASLQTRADFLIGESVRYFWKSNCCISAKVIWRDGTTYGLEHKDVSRNTGAAFPRRPVRIDCRARAECLIDRARLSAVVENISLGGMRIGGLPALATGARIAVVLCDAPPMPASVRWYQRGVAGVRLDVPMTPVMLSQILLDERFAFESFDDA
jgi:hypothetical protein